MPTFEMWGKLANEISIEIEAPDRAAAWAKLVKLSTEETLKQGKVRHRQEITWSPVEIWQVAIDNSLN